MWIGKLGHSVRSSGGLDAVAKLLQVPGRARRCAMRHAGCEVSSGQASPTDDQRPTGPRIPGRCRRMLLYRESVGCLALWMPPWWSGICRACPRRLTWIKPGHPRTVVPAALHHPASARRQHQEFHLQGRLLPIAIEFDQGESGHPHPGPLEWYKAEWKDDGSKCKPSQDPRRRWGGDQSCTLPA